MIWTDLLTILRNNGSFLITSHVSPDGDCIGSQLAMHWYLRMLGKRAVIYNVDPVPSKFKFLKDSDAVSTVRPGGTFDALIVLDCSNLKRLGWDGAERMAPRIVNMDHHRDNTNFGEVNIVRQSAGTGEIMYDFFRDNGIEFPAEVAESLYAAILTDTGGFRFSNTNGRILGICAALTENGANPSRIYEEVYATYSQPAMVLHSRIWSTLQFHLQGRICTMELPLRLIEELGASYSDSEGMADLTIMGTDVQVGMLIKHTGEQSHFSLRSKDRVDVGRIAKKVPGGGGHCNAAGCTIEKPIAAALPEMLGIIQQELG